MKAVTAPGMSPPSRRAARVFSGVATTGRCYTGRGGFNIPRCRSRRPGGAAVCSPAREGRMSFLPAATARALLAGFRAVGLDADVLRQAAGLEPSALEPVDGLLPAGRDRMAEVSDEFTLAVLVGRFRSRPLVPPFRAAQVRLTRPAPERPTRHARLFGAPVAFGCAASALDVPAEAWRARLETADPLLQETLRQLAERIGLGGAGSDLELAVRARLRTLLPDGRGEAEAVARSLGLSGRTLHRRLSAAGLTFRQVLETFREAEAERLLSSGTL